MQQSTLTSTKIPSDVSAKPNLNLPPPNFLLCNSVDLFYNILKIDASCDAEFCEISFLGMSFFTGIR